MRDDFSSDMALNFYTFVPLMKDHLSYNKITFCGPMESFLVAVSLYIHQRKHSLNKVMPVPELVISIIIGLAIDVNQLSMN